MKIFVLGNGFDLACGWNSTFFAFFEDIWKKNRKNKLLNQKNFSDWFKDILEKAKCCYERKWGFYCSLLNHLIDAFLPHLDFENYSSEQMNNFINNGTIILSIFCLLLEINHYFKNLGVGLNEYENNFKNIKWLDIENDLKELSIQENENSLQKILSKIIDDVDITQKQLQQKGLRKESVIFDDLRWLNDFCNDERFSSIEKINKLLIGWVDKFEKDFNNFLYDQTINILPFWECLSKNQAEIYSKLLIKSDVKSNERIKIINFNYTYQYLFIHGNNEDRLTIEYLFSTNKSFSQVNEKKISFLPMSYIHGGIHNPRLNGPQCIIGFNDLRLNNKVDELTKTFKLNTYTSLHNDSDNDDEKFYALNLPILKADEYIDLIFFGHSLGENDWPYFYEIFNKYDLNSEKNSNVNKIYFFFCESLYSQQVAQNVMSKRIKKMFDEYFKKNTDIWRRNKVIMDFKF